MDEKICREYVAILKEELQPAMGCTEPIAVAYCAALARRTLGALPETVEVLASANIIKNVKSVIVPNTNGLRGIAAAAAAGIVADNADAQLQVLAELTPEQVESVGTYLEQAAFTVGRRIRTMCLTFRCASRRERTAPSSRSLASIPT